MLAKKILLTSVFAVAVCCGAGAQEKDEFIDNMPSAWEYSAEFQQDFPSDDKWWKIFNDPLLDSLINEGENNNFNLKEAARRIEIARQTVRRTKSGYYPQFNLDLGWTKERTSGLTIKQGMPSSPSYFSAGIDMSWEIDVFGKIRASVDEEKAMLNATRADYAAVCVSLCAEIATDYMSLRTLQEELRVTQEHIKSQERVLEITEARYEVGLASMLDVCQAKTDYYSTVALVSSLKTQIATTINAISVLVGQYPADITRRLEPLVAPPNPDYVVNVGVPMELLRRRPDIVEAEYTLASYAAALGVAKKDFLPTLSLTGSIGTESMNIKNMFSEASFTYSVAPSLTWTIFNGFAREAEIASAKEQLMVGVDAYNQTVLTAVQEVENAMITYRQSLIYEKEIREVLTFAQKSFELALDRYKQGLDAFINVTDAQMTVLQYANELVEARGTALSSLINLYKALGGGWNVSDM